MDKLQNIRSTLLVLSILGFLFINIPFLYISLFRQDIYHEAMNNILALIFITEAFLLMFLGAFLIAKLNLKRPGWIGFILLSILGSLAFSIPFFLYLHLRKTPNDVVSS